MKGQTASGMFLPGQPFTVTASPGDRLQFATMFVQSNDLFFAPRDGGIALFRHRRPGHPRQGDEPSRALRCRHGGQPAAGRQSGPGAAPSRANTGRAERTPIDLVKNRRDGFAYPAVAAGIEVEIELAAG